MRRSLRQDSDVLAARAKLISTLFARRDGAIPLRKWLIAVRDNVLEEAFREEPGLADEKDNFGDLLEASKSGGALHDYLIEIFGNQGRSPEQLNLMTFTVQKDWSSRP